MNTNGLLQRFQAVLEKREAQSARRRLTIAPRDSVDFSSNDFLSLSKSSALRTAYLKELSGANDIPLGSGGSRLLDGNSEYGEEIERSIASFHNAPAGLLFNSGFDANSGLFACVPQPGDIIVYDEYIHASVHEGMRLSRASSRVSFKHNSCEDFAKVLTEIASKDSGVARGLRNVFVAVESVYSMDGDVAPLVNLIHTLKSHLPHGNGHLIVDEAHSTGVYGPFGRGIVCELGIEDQILARLHTFGKALTSGGAILLCPPIMREYLINYARSLIYTTALGLPTLAMIKTVHGFLREGHTVEVLGPGCGASEAQQRLWSLMSFFQHRLQSLPKSSLIQVPPEPPKSPIFSIRTPHPRSLAQQCQAAALVVRPIVPPTVPEGAQRIRVCLHSGNTQGEVERLIEVIGNWLATFDSDSFVTDGQAKERARL